MPAHILSLLVPQELHEAILLEKLTDLTFLGDANLRRLARYWQREEEALGRQASAVANAHLGQPIEQIVELKRNYASLLVLRKEVSSKFILLSGLAKDADRKPVLPALRAGSLF